MRKPTLVAIAALFAAAGAISPASAALTDRDGGTAWHPTSATQVAKRGGGDRGYRNGPYKGGGYNKNGTPVRKDRRADCDWQKPARNVDACE